MKKSSTYERRFKALLGRLKKAYPPAAPEGLPSDPTEELIWSVLLEDSTEGTAKVGLSRLSGHFVDHNELRVSRPEEIVEALPNTLSEPRARATRIIRSLQAMFDKFDTLTIAELRDQPKREARNFLAAIPEMSAYVEGRVCLLALGIHAMPADRTLIRLLVERGAVHPETDPRDTQGFLERVVPAKDAVETALLLEAFKQDPSRIPALKGAPSSSAAPVKSAAVAKPAPAAKRPAAARKQPAAKGQAARKKK